MYLNNDMSRCRGKFGHNEGSCILRDNCKRYLQYEHEFVHGFGPDKPVSITESFMAKDELECNMFLPHEDIKGGWNECIEL